MANQSHPNRQSHIPQNSIFFEKIVPIVLILLGMITLGLILFAISLLFGIIHV
jgi:hypothetical protein